LAINLFNRVVFADFLSEELFDFEPIVMKTVLIYRGNRISIILNIPVTIRNFNKL